MKKKIISVNKSMLLPNIILIYSFSNLKHLISTNVVKNPSKVNIRINDRFRHQWVSSSIFFSNVCALQTRLSFYPNPLHSTLFHAENIFIVFPKTYSSLSFTWLPFSLLRVLCICLGDNWNFKIHSSRCFNFKFNRRRCN